MNIAELCKGSTADSDSVREGSNPSSAANKNALLSADNGAFLELSVPQTEHLTSLCTKGLILHLGDSPNFTVEIHYRRYTYENKK